MKDAQSKLNGSAANNGRRTIIIGDVHGCYCELTQLLEAIQVKSTDDIISVGDLISKGPDSRSVMNWAMETPNLRCVLGNHEARLLDRWMGGKIPEKHSSDDETRAQLGDSFEKSMKFISSWPLFVRGNDCLVVHAGLDPRIVNLEEQSREDLLTIRVPKGMSIPWYEAYLGQQLVVFGHWAKREPIIRSNAIGLDTACVYGGKLSALILPERRIISIQALREYQRKK